MSVAVTEVVAVTVTVTEPAAVPSVNVETTNVAVQVAAGIVGLPGPVGPQGPAGPSGTSDYTYVQSSPSSSWTINHNLGLYLPVVVLDTSGDYVEGDVVYVSSDTIVVTFSAPFSGVAYVG